MMHPVTVTITHAPPVVTVFEDIMATRMSSLTIVDVVELP